MLNTHKKRDILIENRESRMALEKRDFPPESGNTVMLTLMCGPFLNASAYSIHGQIFFKNKYDLNAGFPPRKRYYRNVDTYVWTILKCLRIQYTWTICF